MLSPQDSAFPPGLKNPQGCELENQNLSQTMARISHHLPGLIVGAGLGGCLKSRYVKES
jgi:hypothetical protein